ncbi:TPA: hypothetical protein ACH3X2_14306 [Trebouxia sp. C0005]
MPVCGMLNAFLLGHTPSKPWTKCRIACQGQAAPPSSGRAKSSKGFGTPSKHRFAKPGVTGKAKQQSRSPSRKQTGQQEVADLAALRQQKATSAAKQARGISGLQRAVAIRGLDALPQPFADAAKAIMAISTEANSKRGRGRGAKQSSIHALLQAYKASFTAALEAEHTEEWQLAEERLSTWPEQRLKEEGLALFGLSASPDGSLYKDSIIRFWGPRPHGLPYHSLSQGDIVLISQTKPGDDALEGVVMDYSSQWVRVAVPQAVAGHLQGQPWRLDQYANTTAHERCMSAVHKFTDPASAAASEVSQAFQRLLLGAGPGLPLKAAAQQPPGWLGGKPGQDRLKTALAALKGATNAQGGVNSSQAAAIKAALTQTLTLWQGPPGTGKTSTLLHFLRLAALVLPKGEGGQIIASAASNVAVDGLVAGLLKQGVNVVRMGQPAKVSPAVQGATLEALIAGHPAGRAAALLQQRAYKMKGKEGMALRQRITRLEEQATDEILGAAQVIAATCVGAGDSRLTGRTFKLCALDEASQATEPASLIPLLCNCEAAVLVGDPCQLPPTVISTQAAEAGLGVSMMERLQAAGIEVQLLKTQYRMHPALAAWPSAAFYGSQLLSHPTPADRQPPKGFQWPNWECPVAFIDCTGPEQRASLSPGSTAGTSYQNDPEAQLVAHAIQQLLTGRHAMQPSDIGVITPYSGQVRKIKTFLEQGSTSRTQPDVKSVDGFQGQEREVIIFSAVRSNAQGRIGFLADVRRLNVALTRARRGFIVIGSKSTLMTNPTWRSWLRWAGYRDVTTNS